MIDFKKRLQEKKLKKLKKSLQIKSLKIELVDIDKIKLWVENPRKNDKGVPDLSKLIAKGGQRSPIVVWAKNQVVYKGNTTLKAMRKAGFKQIAVSYQNFENEETAVAYGLADNKVGELSKWDDEKLSRLIASKFEGVLVKDLQAMSAFGEKDIAILRKDLDYKGIEHDIPKFDIQGKTPGKNYSVSVVFEDPKDWEEFRQEFSLGKRRISITFDDLLEKMEWR